MHLISRETACLCVHTLQVEHDRMVKSGVKMLDEKGVETDGPIIRIKRALDDLIRYDASIVFLQSTLKNLDSD